MTTDCVTGHAPLGKDGLQSVTEAGRGAMEPSSNIQGDFFRIDGKTVGGWVLNKVDTERRLVVELYFGGTPLYVVRADTFVPDLLGRWGSDGCHGFLIRLDGPITEETGLLTAYVANTDEVIGNVPLSQSSADEAGGRHVRGSVRWIGGLRLLGWAHDRMKPAKPLRVFAYSGHELVGEAVANELYEPGRGEALPPGPFGFDMRLSLSLANGELHRIHVRDEQGIELAGSPLAVGTLSSGLAALTGPESSEPGFGRRADYFQQLFPSSLPAVSYEDWGRAYSTAPDKADGFSVVAVLVFGKPDDIALTVESIRNQSSDCWILLTIDDSEPLSGTEWAAIRADIQSEATDQVLFLHAGDLLHVDTLSHFAAAHEKSEQFGIMYADSEIIMEDGTRRGLFKTAFDLERCRSQGYAFDIAMASKDLLPEFSANEEISLDKILAGAFANALRHERPIAHLPQVLVTLADRSMERRKADLQEAIPLLCAGKVDEETHIEDIGGTLRPALRIRRRIDRHNHVSIIIPTRDRVDLLRACIESLRQCTEWPHYDVIVVDNDSSDKETLQYLTDLERLGNTILRQPGPFNYSRLNNAAAASARGPFLLLLNNDTECVEKGWLTAMLEAAQDEDVGAVGARLLWPSGIVQHGGVVLGPYMGAVHAFNDHHADDSGYDDLMCVSHEASAVTAACLLLRKADYFSVGGLDERLFPVNFNDVDLCLKLRQAGKRNIWTPHATLLHKESASRGQDLGLERQGRATRELRHLRLKWGEALLTDPYYSPCLNLDGYPYSGLAWPPRKRSVRLNMPPQPASVDYA